MSSQETDLPRHLVDQLSTGERKALRNPHRRHILRALREEGQKRSPKELVQQGRSSCPLASTAYHMRTLMTLGLLKDEGFGQARGAVKHYFSASISAGSAAVEVLTATETADQKNFALRTS